MRSSTSLFDLCEPPAYSHRCSPESASLCSRASPSWRGPVTDARIDDLDVHVRPDGFGGGELIGLRLERQGSGTGSQDGLACDDPRAGSHSDPVDVGDLYPPSRVLIRFNVGGGAGFGLPIPAVQDNTGCSRPRSLPYHFQAIAAPTLGVGGQGRPGGRRSQGKHWVGISGERRLLGLLEKAADRKAQLDAKLAFKTVKLAEFSGNWTPPPPGSRLLKPNSASQPADSAPLPLRWRLQRQI